jgi:hypothetical protein
MFGPRTAHMLGLSVMSNDDTSSSSPLRASCVTPVLTPMNTDYKWTTARVVLALVDDVPEVSDEVRAPQPRVALGDD